MKTQALFSSKKKVKIKMSSAAFLFGDLRVKLWKKKKKKAVHTALILTAFKF